MRVFLLALAAAVCMLAASGQADTELRSVPAQAHAEHTNPCDEADTIALTECGNREEQAAEKQLHHTYWAAIKGIEQDQQKRLRRIQHLWLQYRDAECKAEGEVNSTLRTAFTATYIAGQDKRRSRELRNFYLR